MASFSASYVSFFFSNKDFSYLNITLKPFCRMEKILPSVQLNLLYILKE